ncbi:hypothetical protein JAAARDRAFT_624083 [Jaapia argillacea MUCL 33604]|uniref:Histone H1 n=1 Tax=Jaapia argillacea MUCL 33604 TaxID=933084 RepID=A0A067PXV4_9AGAM|nr:hypothetical protein JAAARDRAFT_624083 [Jaapia argillacea MUCL 33604]
MSTASNKKSTTKKPAAKKVKAVPSHPPWIDMIKECIASNTEDARHGVSRPQIKNFVESEYKLEIGNAQNTQLSKAIATGVEKGEFVLPKGPSGRVKLAPKTHKADVSAKENKPTPKVVAKPAPKAAAKVAPAKSSRSAPAAKKATTTAKATTTKRTAAAKPAAKPAAKIAKTAKPSTKAKAAPTKKAEPKKTTAGRKSAAEKKTTASSRRGTAKKSVTGTSASSKAKSAATTKSKVPAKRTTANSSGGTARTKKPAANRK